MNSCKTSQRVSERYEQHIEFSDRFDSVNEQILVVVYDTLREVTTITFRVSETGDTVRTDKVTDRSTTRETVKSEMVKCIASNVSRSSDTAVFIDTVVVQNSPATPSLRGAEPRGATKQSTRRVVIAIIILLAILVTCRLVTFLQHRHS